MSRPLLLLLAGALLTACETTGDPSQGGLFGWSQQKADQRINDRQTQLQSLQESNAYEAGRTSSLQQTANERQQQLNQQQQQ
jgi:hypothetical protein